MAYQFKLPGRTIIGEHALDAGEAAIRGMGRKALVVTGKIITGNGVLKQLADRLERWGVGYEVFNDVVGEPTDETVGAGVRAYRAAGCDFLIAIGGGSPLDTAKAVAAMTCLGGRISDYMGVEMEGNFPPMALIPTTAGTGSEATRFAVISDTRQNVKMLLRGDALLPGLAVVDPALTLSAPPGTTAATGMDALTHAVEAYTSRKANPLTDLYALDAIRRIFQSLPDAYEDGGNRGARAQMSIAAYEAGVCINNASVTVVHGMSRPIGALFHVPHGLSNAMLIVECLSYVADGCYERLAEIARAIGAADETTGEKAASEAFLRSLNGLCRKLEIPTPAAYGIGKEEFDRLVGKMARDAMASGSPSNTWKELTQDDLAAIYRRLW